jgi:hypothetical protein
MAQVEKNSASSGLITTSHNPSHFLRQLSKLLTFCLPNSGRLNRGSLNKKQLFNYCWNNKVPRLIIVQGSEKTDSAFLELYNLEKSQKPVNSVIEVTKTFFPKKGVKKTRIDAKSITLNFSDDIPTGLRDCIDISMKPFLVRDTKFGSDSNLVFHFAKYESNQLLGYITRENKKETVEILTYSIKDKEKNGN